MVSWSSGSTPGSAAASVSSRSTRAGSAYTPTVAAGPVMASRSRSSRRGVSSSRSASVRGQRALPIRSP